MPQNPDYLEVPAIRVSQWMPMWDDIDCETPTRGRPPRNFYLLSMSAYHLRRLSGIYRRDPNKKPAEDMGIQRRHLPEKSAEIFRYILDGFPLSKIRRSRLVDQSEVKTLRMPGWLSTAVVVNILDADARRGHRQSRVPKPDLVTVTEGGNQTAIVRIPRRCLEPSWQPVIHPIEVIDGQHRLWALEEPDEDRSLWSADTRQSLEKLEIPVVAFCGLDVTWQAYLFYTINQLPKKVDPSLVYDLYPLLRTQEWLERFEGPEIYRQTRAQDLTLLLWSNPLSPWKDRISRLGREKGKVTQAAFVRSLMASFIKRYTPVGKAKIGGLFGSPTREHGLVLGWTREQQAAFLIMVWEKIDTAICCTSERWAEALRGKSGHAPGEKDFKEAPFRHPLSLLTTDQGVRCALSIMNDILWLAYEEDHLLLDAYDWARDSQVTDDDVSVQDALTALHQSIPEAEVLAREIAEALSEFDWRASSALDPKQDADDYNRQASYRGSSGYMAMRRNALNRIHCTGTPRVSGFARQVIGAMGYTPEEEEV